MYPRHTISDLPAVPEPHSISTRFPVSSRISSISSSKLVLFSGAAAQIECLARRKAHVILRQAHGANQILDKQQIAHLPSVAVYCDRLALHSLSQEVRHPSLIFRAELMRAVDAAHAEYSRTNAVRARVIQHILIRAAL